MGRGLDGYFLYLPIAALCGFQASPGRSSRKIPVAHSERETPLPIPNRAVKPFSADGTWGATPWESRSLPVLLSGPRWNTTRAAHTDWRRLRAASVGLRSAATRHLPPSPSVSPLVALAPRLIPTRTAARDDSWPPEQSAFRGGGRGGGRRGGGCGWAGEWWGVDDRHSSAKFSQRAPRARTRRAWRSRSAGPRHRSAGPLAFACNRTWVRKVRGPPDGNWELQSGLQSGRQSGLLEPFAVRDRRNASPMKERCEPQKREHRGFPSGASLRLTKPRSGPPRAGTLNGLGRVV